MRIGSDSAKAMLVNYLGFLLAFAGVGIITAGAAGFFAQVEYTLLSGIIGFILFGAGIYILNREL